MKTTGGMLLLAFAATGWAQAQQADVMQMPARDVFVVQQCMPAMNRRAVFADPTVQAGFAEATCECSYRLLAPHETVSRRMFDDAGLLCQAEFDDNPLAFVVKYTATAR